MSYVIEDGIPLSPRPMNGLIPRYKSEERKTVEMLAVGQSVLFCVDKKKSHSILSGAKSSDKTKKFAARAVDGGYRVWRLA